MSMNKVHAQLSVITDLPTKYLLNLLTRKSKLMVNYKATSFSHTF